MKTFALALFAVAATSTVQAACPSGYEALGPRRCVRATGYADQNTAIESCDEDGEVVLDGSNKDLFQAAMRLLIKPNVGPGGQGGGPNPGRFFWTTGMAGPLCVAGWSRSEDYVEVACTESYPAICLLRNVVTNPNHNSWSAVGTSQYQSASDWGPHFAIDSTFHGGQKFYHSNNVPLDYLQIDLGAEYEVIDINVRARTSCCTDRFHHHEARVGNTNSIAVEGTGSQLSANDQCGQNSGPGPRTQYKFVCGTSSGISGRYITIQITQAPHYILQIEEVDITAFGDF